MTAVLDLLNQSTVDALAKTDVVELEYRELSKIIFFTDGSYCPTTARASWAFVVGGFQNGSSDFTLFGWHYGLVQTDEMQEDWLGASSASSFTAEQTAMLQAIWYAVQLPFPIDIEFGYDNLAAAKMTSGEWQLNQGNVMSRFARAAFQLLSFRQGRDPKCFHIQAHTGHPWNDMADAIAKIAMKTQGASQQPKMDMRLWLQGFQPLVEQIPFYWQLFKDNTSYPQCDGETVSWARLQNFDFAPPDFVRQEQDDNFKEMTDTFSLTLISYNVCTFAEKGSRYDEPWKAEYLRAQLTYAGVTVVALQETRACSSIFLQTPDFLRFVGQADQGQGGVELWFSIVLKFGKDSYFTKDMFQVVLDTPRLLAVIAT